MRPRALPAASCPLFCVPFALSPAQSCGSASYTATALYIRAASAQPVRRLPVLPGLAQAPALRCALPSAASLPHSHPRVLGGTVEGRGSPVPRGILKPVRLPPGRCPWAGRLFWSLCAARFCAVSRHALRLLCTALSLLLSSPSTSCAPRLGLLLQPAARFLLCCAVCPLPAPIFLPVLSCAVPGSFLRSHPQPASLGKIEPPPTCCAFGPGLFGPSATWPPPGRSLCWLSPAPSFLLFYDLFCGTWVFIFRLIALRGLSGVLLGVPLCGRSCLVGLLAGRTFALLFVHILVP